MTDRTTHRQVVYRLLPGSRAKARRLAALAGACRFVWNEMLDQQEQLYAIARMQGAKPPAPTFFTLGKAFTQLRRSRRGENHRLRGAAAGWATRIAEGPSADASDRRSLGGWRGSRLLPRSPVASTTNDQMMVPT